jgi:DNA invertase Pin-like site-specific DNA recombinase
MRRLYWILAAFLILVAAGWFLIARPQPHYIAPNILAPADVVGVRQADAQARVDGLASQAPAFQNANFGPGTRTVFYRAGWQVRDGFEASNGTMYVILLQSGGVPAEDRYTLASLWAVRLQNVPLPNISGGFNYLEFAPSTVTQRVVLDAQTADGHNYRFLVTQNRIMSLPYVRESGSFSDNYRLSSGAVCKDNDNPSLPYAIYTVGARASQYSERIRAYCVATDRKLTAVIRDEGYSGKDLRRPGIQRVLQAVRDRAVKTIIVLKLDRLTRNLGDLCSTMADFRKYNVDLVSVSEAFDTSLASGRLMMNVLGSFAEWERERIGERTSDALHFAKSQGVRLGRVPFGCIRSGGKLVKVHQPPQVGPNGTVIFWAYSTTGDAHAQALYRAADYRHLARA